MEPGETVNPAPSSLLSLPLLEEPQYKERPGSEELTLSGELGHTTEGVTELGLEKRNRDWHREKNKHWLPHGRQVLILASISTFKTVSFSVCFFPLFPAPLHSQTHHITIRSLVCK